MMPAPLFHGDGSTDMRILVVLKSYSTKIIIAPFLVDHVSKFTGLHHPRRKLGGSREDPTVS
jgi:hypothetical protein